MSSGVSKCQGPKPTVDRLGRGRESFRRQAWAAAYTTLAHVDQSVSLGAEDVERLAIAAYLLGKDADSEDLWARAHKQCLEADDLAGAARCAFWLALGLVLRGEMARGVAGSPALSTCSMTASPMRVEFGYLRIPAALQSIAGGDYGVALASFGEAAQAARRFGDPDLQAMARLGEGQTRIRLDQTAEGVALLERPWSRSKPERCRSPCRHHLLRGDRGVPRRLRSAPGAGVDVRP